MALFMLFVCVGCQVWLQIGTNFGLFWDQLLIVWLGEPECTKMWSGQFDLSDLGANLTHFEAKTNIHGLHHLLSSLPPTTYTGISSFKTLSRPKATLCQRVSQSDSKWPRKTRTNKHTDKHIRTHTHFRIYISRD